MAARDRTSRNTLPVRRIEAVEPLTLAPGSWPRTVPAVDQLLREGLDLGPVTVLVGENGSGKSTVVEAVAAAYGIDPEGGSVHSRHATRPTGSGLEAHLRLSRGLTAFWIARVSGWKLKPSPTPKKTMTIIAFHSGVSEST